MTDLLVDDRLSDLEDRVFQGGGATSAPGGFTEVVGGFGGGGGGGVILTDLAFSSGAFTGRQVIPAPKPGGAAQRLPVVCPFFNYGAVASYSDSLAAVAGVVIRTGGRSVSS